MKKLISVIVLTIVGAILSAPAYAVPVNSRLGHVLAPDDRVCSIQKVNDRKARFKCHSDHNPDGYLWWSVIELWNPCTNKTWKKTKPVRYGWEYNTGWHPNGSKVNCAKLNRVWFEDAAGNKFL